jgi:hypothetical protein
MMNRIGAVITAARERASALVIGLSLATVAITTGFISYTHIAALTIHENQSWKSAHLYPLAVDGQIAIGSVILMEVKGRHRWWGLVGFIPGLLESLVANWASGYAGHNVAAGLWSTVPAQAFACSTFLFEMWLRHRRASKPAARPLATAVLAASHLAMQRIAEQLLPQAPGEPAAPVAPEAVPCRDPRTALSLTACPAGAPWGLVSLADAPAPEPGPVPVTALSLPYPLPGMGRPVPLMPGTRPAPARRRAPAAVADADDTRLPLPEDEGELAALVNRLTRNELFQQYQVSKYGADKLRKQYLTDENESSEEVA